MAEKKGQSIELQLPDDGVVSGDSVLLGRLFDNLLDNACRHTPPGGTVTLAGVCDGSCWRLSVANTGSLIDPELREEIFERFRRGDPARQRETGGAGLGLALCQTIARLHGGVVQLDDAEGEVTRFTVELPVSWELVAGSLMSLRSALNDESGHGRPGEDVRISRAPGT